MDKDRIVMILIFSILLNLFLFFSLIWKSTSNINDDLNFQLDVKQGKIIYNNTRLIDYIRKEFLIPPSDIHENKSISKITHYSQIGQDKFLDKLLNERRNGFFIEVGAYDGEHLSNTLFFERERNWTGLLIEANPTLFKKLKSRDRNAYVSHSCISLIPYAIEVNFTFADYYGGVIAPTDKSVITGNGSVQCIPFMTYLMALNIYHVDYFSLDIEGGELDVLKQIDFKKFQIDVLTIEYATNNYQKTSQKLKDITELLVGTGLYRLVTTMGGLDAIFMRNPL
ncbi:unnamed protein product [Adineta steineri]|uniref:Methyltransferase FkbM domain-containing protein n=1 Tax=Adineta steineri TaxID=433720 RepID=A0A815A5R9_9BILA|nr:unnamed protein product [Adineta steineri]CAF3516136.1 unnamed protein product [Adineta steineri]